VAGITGIFESLIDKDGDSGESDLDLGSHHPRKIGRNLLSDSNRTSESNPPILNKNKNQTLPTIPPLPDIELTPLKTSTPTSRIAPPALIKGRLNESLRF